MAEEQISGTPEAAQPENDGNRTAGEQQETPVGLTQAQLNAIIATEKKKARLSALQEVGDVDALKAKAAKLDELEAANMSEIEKLQKQLNDMQTQVQAKEQEAQAARLTASRIRVGSELGLPSEIAELLKGDTDDDMREHAQSLITSLEKMGINAKMTPPNIDATKGGEQRSSTKTADLPPAIKKLIERGMITAESYLAAQDAMEGKL